MEGLLSCTPGEEVNACPRLGDDMGRSGRAADMRVSEQACVCNTLIKMMRVEVKRNGYWVGDEWRLERKTL